MWLCPLEQQPYCYLHKALFVVVSLLCYIRIAWKTKGKVCGMNEIFLSVVTEDSFPVVELLSKMGKTISNPCIVLRVCDIVTVEISKEYD